MQWRMKVPQSWIHRVSNPGPSGLKSSVLPPHQAHRRWGVDPDDRRGFHLGLNRLGDGGGAWNAAACCNGSVFSLQLNSSVRGIILGIFFKSDLQFPVFLWNSRRSCEFQLIAPQNKIDSLFLALIDYNYYVCRAHEIEIRPSVIRVAIISVHNARISFKL